MSIHAAIDIGAGSGRIIIATFENSNITLKEIHRFQVSIVENQGLRIDLVKLIYEIRLGIQKTENLFPVIDTIGIDTWGVDFVALNKEHEIIQMPMFYRDESFKLALKEYEYNLEELFMKTGIQIQPFNTYFQLQKLKDNFNEDVEKIVLLPDYLNFVLTNKLQSEFTNMTTTQCLKLGSKKTLQKVDKLFPLVGEKRDLGFVKKKSQIYCKNLECAKVISVASHDTASAYQAIAHDMEDTIFISSGTWSLIGVRTMKPIVSRKVFKKNYSNEGSYDGSYRLQKNIMGMWLVQNLSKQFGNYNYESFSELANRSTINSIVNVDDERLLNPKNMFKAICEICESEKQVVPKTFSDALKVAYDSIAYAYVKSVEELVAITNKKYNKIVIVGGGANAVYLNEKFSQQVTQKVFLFKHEASVIGNIYVQLKESKTIVEEWKIKELIAKNFDLEEVNNVKKNN